MSSATLVRVCERCPRRYRGPAFNLLLNVCRCLNVTLLPGDRSCACNTSPALIQSSRQATRTPLQLLSCLDGSSKVGIEGIANRDVRQEAIICKDEAEKMSWLLAKLQILVDEGGCGWWV
eukprot:1160202-Pelagomonas_calceolata.AAC.9